MISSRTWHAIIFSAYGQSEPVKFTVAARGRFTDMFRQVIFNPCDAESTFCPRHNMANIFDNYLNPITLLFI